MRKHIVILLLLSTNLIFAQKGESDMFIQNDEFDVVEPIAKNKKKKKVFTNIAIGSSVMSSGSGNYSINTYVNPTIGYQLSPKLSVSVGLMAVQSNLNDYNYYNYNEGQIQTLNYSGLSSFVTLQGAYQINEKLKVYGGVMIGSRSIDFTGVELQGENSKIPTAYRIGVEYKIGEHATIQLEFQHRDMTPMQQMQMQSGSGNGFGIMNNSSMFGCRNGMW